MRTAARARNDGDELPDGGRFIPKPYGPAQVIETLRENMGLERPKSRYAEAGNN